MIECKDGKSRVRLAQKGARESWEDLELQDRRLRDGRLRGYRKRQLTDTLVNLSIGHMFLISALGRRGRRISVSVKKGLGQRQGFSGALEPALELVLVDQAGLELTEILAS